MAVQKFFRWLTGGGARADVSFDPDFIPSSDEKDAMSPTGYTPSATDTFTTELQVNDEIEARDWQESVTYEINYVHDEAPDGRARSGTCDFTDAGGGKLNCYDVGHDFQLSGVYLVTFTSATYGTFSGLIDVVDVNNFEVTKAYISDENNVPYSYVGPLEGEKCLNTNTIAVAAPLLHTFTGGSWNAGAGISVEDRFIWRTSGNDSTGESGDNTADDKIRTYTDAAAYTFRVMPAALTTGAVYLLEEDSVLYEFDGSNHNEFRKRSGLILFHFRGDATGIGQSQTDVAMWDASDILNGVIIPYDFYLTASTLQSDSPRSAGTLTVEPTINGTKVTPSDLDLVLDGVTTNDASATAAQNTSGLIGSADDKVGAKYTTDASWAATSGTESIVFGLHFIEK